MIFPHPALLGLSMVLFGLILPSPQPEGSLPDGILARGEGFEISETDYRRYLVSLLEGEEIGRELLDQLVRETAVALEAERRDIQVSQRLLDQRLMEIDEKLKAETGGEGGLSKLLEEQEIAPAAFALAVKLSMAHETMARQDYDLDQNEPISTERLNIWLRELVAGMEIEPLPEEDPGLIRVGGRVVTRAIFGERLASSLGKEKAAEHLSELIGIRLIQIQAREMKISLSEEDRRREIVEREAKMASMEGLAGISYEQYLAAVKGMTLEELKKTEKFEGEVLLKKICDTLHHEAFLQDFFEQNRADFNRRFGRAARLSTIFLRAARFQNQFIARSYEEALEELEAVKDRLDRGEVTFAEMARVYSEHESRERGGDLGYVSVHITGWEEIVQKALEAEKEAILGPFQLPEGCHLLQVTGFRKDPSFSELREEVRREARARHYANLVRQAQVERRF